MPKIPSNILENILSDPKYKRCIRADEGNCSGNISFEEVFLFGGKQIKEKWNIIPLCHKHHGIGIWMDTGFLNKRMNEWYALNQATDEELERYSKIRNLIKYRELLNGEFPRESNG